MEFPSSSVSVSGTLTPVSAQSTLIEDVNATRAINDLAGNLANQGWSAVDHQMRIVESEFNELRDGINERDIHELRDGIGDLLFTVIGLAHRAGLDLEGDFHEVVRANLTKFDSSLDDVAKTREKYNAYGITTYSRMGELYGEDGSVQELHVTFSTSDQTDSTGKTYPGNKWLKSHRFKDVEFEPLPEHSRLVQSSTKPASFICNALASNALAYATFRATVAKLAGDAVQDQYESELDASRNSHRLDEGAQRFTAILMSGYNVPTGLGLLLPIREINLANPWMGIAGCFEEPISSQILEFSTALAKALADDSDFVCSWHANLTMAFIDADIPRSKAEQISNHVLEKLFGVSSKQFFHS